MGCSIVSLERRYAVKTKQPRERLDTVMVERGLARDLKEARARILAGEVRVEGEPQSKAGTLVRPDALVERVERRQFVSRGAYKLVHGLDTFAVDPSGKICADVGASTGGFTEVLLQRGASTVYAIDVGYGDLAYKLRTDSRVVVMERTNARLLTQLPRPIALVVLDLSFISLRAVLPTVRNWLNDTHDVVALVKPQFEAPREAIEEGGIVRDAQQHLAVLESFYEWCGAEQWGLLAATVSPILGGQGNREFLAHLRAGHPSAEIDLRTLALGAS